MHQQHLIGHQDSQLRFEYGLLKYEDRKLVITPIKVSDELFYTATPIAHIM
jgi:hypothetical protein